VTVVPFFTVIFAEEKAKPEIWTETGLGCSGRSGAGAGVGVGAGEEAGFRSGGGVVRERAQEYRRNRNRWQYIQRAAGVGW